MLIISSLPHLSPSLINSPSFISFIISLPRQLSVLLFFSLMQGECLYMNSVKWPCSPWVLVAQWIEHTRPVFERSWVQILLGIQIFSLSHTRVMLITCISSLSQSLFFWSDGTEHLSCCMEQDNMMRELISGKSTSTCMYPVYPLTPNIYLEDYTVRRRHFIYKAKI